jgi:GNAT superfamily N-acetyltransferase
LKPQESAALGELMVRVYSQLPGFPSPSEQPDYYEMLRDIGAFADKPGARVLVAHSPDRTLLGGVVYFGDMAHYGSGGTATAETDASGFRLLGVDPQARGSGAGKALTNACIELAREAGHSQVILHTTMAMQVAWGLYERMGFQRSEDLDFLQEELPVFGFRLQLDGAGASSQPAPENRSMTLPTEHEISPIPEDLDGKVAVKNFLGKTLQDAVAMFDENSLVYQEDLMWMGPPAFCFYLPAVLKHFERQEDDELVPFIASLFEFRLKHDAAAIEPCFPTMAEICEHLLRQGENYVGSSDKKRFQKILRKITE